VEFRQLFERGVGEETDIIQKEMFMISTRGANKLVLRPEETAPMMRAYLQHNLGRAAQPQRLYSMGPFFRHENPQLGRYRQFSQVDFEVIGGTNDPLYDAQVIIVCQRFLEQLKIKNSVLKINSIGCRVCRPLYRRQLQAYYKNHEKDLCTDCVRRLKKNPLRLMDCKEEQCKKFKDKAPAFLDKLCVTCSRHLKTTLEYLDEVGIAYLLSNDLVRGFDYYSRTVFEFYIEGALDLGAVGGGGRYDYLAEMLGGRLTPAVGGALGVERLIAVMKAQDIKMPTRSQKKVFLAHVGELAKKKSLKLIEELREADIPVHEALAKESLKAQLKQADREGVGFALIFGQKEIYEGSIIIRDLRTGLQDTVSLDRIVVEIRKRWRQE
jgi:histidyl-tRNA synthetase